MMPAKKTVKKKIDKTEITSEQKPLKKTDETMLMESMFNNIEILSDNMDFLKGKIEALENKLASVASRLGLWKYLPVKQREEDCKTM